MSICICTVDGFDVTKVKVGKPYFVKDDAVVFDIKYNGGMLLIQTPVAVIPYSYSLYDNNVFKMTVVCEGTGLYSMMQAVCDSVLQKVTKYDESLLKGKDVKTLVGMKIVEREQSQISVGAKDIGTVGFFDRMRKAIGLSSIHSFDRVICLFEVRRLVVKGECVFWQANLLQVKQCSFVFSQARECIIVDETSQYEAYDKMQKLGIHIDAIKHKMKMDGLDEGFYERWSRRRTHTGSIPLPPPLPPPLPVGLIPKPPLPPPPPPPLPPPLFGSAQTGSPGAGGPLAFLKDISSGNFMLKKSGEGSKKLLVSRERENEYKAPSLEQIKTALSKLKRVDGMG